MLWRKKADGPSAKRHRAAVKTGHTRGVKCHRKNTPRDVDPGRLDRVRDPGIPDDARAIEHIECPGIIERDAEAAIDREQSGVHVALHPVDAKQRRLGAFWAIG